MNTCPPKPLAATSSLRTAKATLLSILMVIPVSLVFWGLIILFQVIALRTPPEISDLYNLTFWITLSGIPTALLIMLLFGLPCFILARKHRHVTLQNALITGIFASFLMGIFLALTIGFTLAPIILVPYGLAISWTFYHLVKDPNAE